MWLVVVKLTADAERRATHTIPDVRVLPRVPSGQGMSLVSPDVTCRAPRVPDAPVSGLLMSLASALD